MPDQEAYARFTDENGKTVAGQFKTKLDVFAAKMGNMAVRVGVTDAEQVPKAMIHEMGTYHPITFEEGDKKYTVKGVPARSFIRMPLALFLPKAIEEVKILEDDVGNDKINYEAIANALGEASVEVIQEAFDTQGFGNWLPHQSKEYAENNDNPVLDKTGALRNSIGYEIIERETI